MPTVRDNGPPVANRGMAQVCSSTMRRLLAAISCVLAGLVPLPPVAHAELIRIDLAPVDAGGIPRSFDEIRGILEGAGLAVAWADQPYYQPGFAHGSGASYASMAVTWGADTVQLTWYDFDDPDAAELFASEAIAARYAGDPTATRVENGYVLETYSYNYDPVASLAVMEIITGSQ